jgi:D-glycero-D-manno-heptose 1,7-bisphosphate phosphatase
MFRALFIDRDGVINIEKEYLYKQEDFEFIPGAVEGLKLAQDAGFKLIVITNQSGIGRGYYTNDDFKKLTIWMRKTLYEQGVKIDDVLHCPHTLEDECSCRKPHPGLVNNAAVKHKIDLANSLLVGDKESDILTAKHAHLKASVLVRSGHKIDESSTKATYIEDDLLSAVKKLLNLV